MKIYVQSRGYDQDKDYCWIQPIADGIVQAEIPPLSKNAISLLETSFPSVVLERLPDERLLLLITGLEPEDRFDIINRQIRIDLAFVAPNTGGNESLLRHLAACALSEEKRQLLTGEVSQAVGLLKNPDFLQVYPEDLERIKIAFESSNFNTQQELARELNLPEETVSNFCEGKPVKYQELVEIDRTLELSLTRAKEIYLPPYDRLSPEEENIYTNFVQFGFYVSVEKFSAIVSGEQNSELLSSDAPDLRNRIGVNSSEFRKELAEELIRSKLPLKTAPLVVVTGFKKMEKLVEAKIWRGLSKLIETEGWTEISPSQLHERFSLSTSVEMIYGWFKSFSALIFNQDKNDSPP